MFERFSENSIKVVMWAQEESRLLGHNIVGTEQLLLGLRREGSGIVGKIFNELDINFSVLRREVESIIGRGDGFVAMEVPFTERAKRALKNSWEASRQLKDNFIGVEHLLLGVVSQTDCVAVQALQQLGINVEQMRDRILELRGASGPSNVQPPSSSPASNIVRLDQAKHEISVVVSRMNGMNRALETAKEKVERCADDITQLAMPTNPDVQQKVVAINQELKQLQKVLEQDTADFLKVIADLEEHLKRIHPME